MIRAWYWLLAGCCVWGAGYVDRTHESRVFRGQRSYRLFLPPGYDTSGISYPVIYYFHGHSDRYTLERMDKGSDTIPKITAFVAANPVIVVAVDGYVASDYTGFYGGSPWDVRVEGGDYDFGSYYHELVSHVDTTYRTLTSRRYRATSGLSMGGYMSLYLSARYPDMIGSASAFNPGPEFYAGEKGRRSLWRPKDHVRNHAATRVRLVAASGDYISQYHQETHAAYAREADVAYEFRQDEYHRHWATSIAETFAFHRQAFARESLDKPRPDFDYDSAYADFSVWGWRVRRSSQSAAITYLSVRDGVFRLTTRRWAPDGPASETDSLEVTTPPLYHPGKSYQWLDYCHATGKTARREAAAGGDGRLRFVIDGAGHEVSVAGLDRPALRLLPLTSKDKLRLAAGVEHRLPVRIYNAGFAPATGAAIRLASEYPTVAITGAEARIASLSPGESVDLSDPLRARFAAGDGSFQHARLSLSTGDSLDILIAPEDPPAPMEWRVLDGVAETFAVFRQNGNRGGGASISRAVCEGAGNGNGILEPGEEATIWVRLRQGLDPFDKGNWYRA